MFQGPKTPRRAVLSLAAVLPAAGLAWNWPVPRLDGGDHRLVRVGLYQNAPKVYSDADGRPTGLFVELLEAMASAEGWRLSYEPCQWAECLDRLERGELDPMPDVAFSGERAQRFDFHQVSVASSWSQIYSRPELPIHTINDLAGKRVAVLQGGIQQGQAAGARVTAFLLARSVLRARRDDQQRQCLDRARHHRARRQSRARGHRRGRGVDRADRVSARARVRSIQGYLISRPLPVAEITAFLEQARSECTRVSQAVRSVPGRVPCRGRGSRRYGRRCAGRGD
ncbi:hypothetical protein Atep_04670 [Allochromatium tepidum]|uniref:Solute-binding protein family 3/N-terminal domain-containing protein n=1 Tax=Allochromatium tepidum TaxID=553982 RepID=A0ABM7QJ50_9GAMM|nr:hypothetical protein Atep_04670 [Allochromatium tepidum]